MNWETIEKSDDLRGVYRAGSGRRELKTNLDKVEHERPMFSSVQTYAGGDDDDQSTMWLVFILGRP